MALLALVLLIVNKDTLRFNPAQEVSAPYAYDLIQWQVTKPLSKWLHWLVTALTLNTVSDDEKHRQVNDYFRLGGELADRMLQLSLMPQQNREIGRITAIQIESDLEEIRLGLDDLSDDVEETIESTISLVIAEADLDSWNDFPFPPVDVRLGDTPKLLVTSPRNRILRVHDVLIDADVKVAERQKIEDSLLRQHELSALVIDIGGIATYPASIPNLYPLDWTLQASAHEWLHHYFFFKPLGRNIFSSSDMQVLNETVSDMAGHELGALAYDKLRDNQRTSTSGDPGQTQYIDGTFNFDSEMRETRLRVDELLEEGKIAEAEAFMEKRRLFFVENQYPIRKLNQAYFAFHGTYAGSGASVSPIGDQVRRFRELMPDVGIFVRTISQMSNYEQFLELLKQLESRDTGFLE